tara:strand:- start:413 stop:625 length:213 start_codon:yes stop_codon:yes gene_type:complete
MGIMWEKKHRVVQSGGWGRDLKSFEKFRTMAMVSKEELIAYLNKHNAKPKMKAKALKELAKRGVKLTWKY